jgi:large subunit ribosomal protein L10
MPKTKEQKKELIDFYREKLSNAKAIYVIDAAGVSATETIEIKKELYDMNSSYHVIKNRLFKIALENEGVEKSEEFAQGQHGVVFADEENMTTAAKALKKFIMERDSKEDIEIKGGILDKKIITKDEVIELAELPGRDEMIAIVAGTMNAPVSGFVRVMAANISGFMNVLNALKNQKSE